MTTSGDKIKENNLLQSIAIIEARLEWAEKEESHDDNQQKENVAIIFPTIIKCHYYSLLSDNCLQLYVFYRFCYEANSSSENYNNVNKFSVKSMEVLEKSMKLASESLDYHEPLRLLVTYNYCKALCMIQQKYYLAKVIAEKIFLLANDHKVELLEESIKVLQKLRDDFMNYIQPKLVNHPKPIRKYDAGKILSLTEVNKAYNAVDDGKLEEKDPVSEEQSLKEELQKIETQFLGIRKSNKFQQLQQLKKQRSQFQLLEEREPVITDLTTTVSRYNEHQNNKKYRTAVSIRRQITLVAPIQIESLSASHHLLKALDRIFRAYIKGNALPGQQSGGSSVDLAGSTLSFRTFVLQGPYMSWKGFVSFLLDFSVAILPDNNSRLGRNFYRSLNYQMAKDLLGQLDAVNDPESSPVKAVNNAPEPVVSMLEAAITFIESARSATPALIMRRYLDFYKELAKSLPSDPWNEVYDWTIQDSLTDGNNEWEIAYGVNFVQFVDCLGKLGILAYSSHVFHEMLPTNSEKIEHFLTAFLGLSDERKWYSKVDGKLKKVRSVIKDLTMTNKESTNAKNVEKN